MSRMQHVFSQVPSAQIPRSTFTRSHGLKTAFDAGYLVPIYVDEALPGDTFKCRNNIFARLNTPVVPILDNLYIDTFYFAVPIRLIWDHWQAFNGERVNPDDEIDYVVPQIESPAGGWPIGSLSDYFGLPTGVGNLSVASFWHRAYNLIYNEWFRDENLQDSLAVPKGDGPDSDTLFRLRRRGKRHDYFTSCLPWPQKGPGVDMPIGGSAALSGRGMAEVKAHIETGFVPVVPHLTGISGVSTPEGFPYGVTHKESQGDEAYFTQTNSADAFFVEPSQLGAGHLYADLNSDALSGITVNLAGASAASINSLREAFQIQHLLERDARGGSRYTEILRSHFGVVSPDSRLQRPEYLGGNSTPIKVVPVPQTSATGGSSPQGNLAAYGLAASSSGFTKSFVEHCVVIGLAEVRADLTYQQGVSRMFSRKTRYDFYWPALAHLGEQAVLNKEIFAQGTADDDKVFGYQERWAEYRYYPSQITGMLRSTADQSLDVWHLAEKFENLPTLSAEFIEDKPPVDRVVAVPDEPNVLFDSYMELKCARPMPVYSVPGLIDHF